MKVELCHVVQRSTGMTFSAGYYPVSMYYSRLFKALSRRKITPDYYDCHVRREAFVGPRRYDVEQSRFFRLTSVHAMNLRVLRSLGVFWFIRNARFRIFVSLFLSRLDSDQLVAKYANSCARKWGTCCSSDKIGRILYADFNWKIRVKCKRTLFSYMFKKKNTKSHIIICTY